MEFKNFKKILIDYMDNYQNNYEEEINKNDKQAWSLVRNILEGLYCRYLKHYNLDETKAYDNFITSKILEILNIYVDEIYLLDKNMDEENDETKYYSIRKEMRRIMHYLYEVYRENI